MPDIDETLDYAQAVREAKGITAEEAHAIAVLVVMTGARQMVSVYGSKHIARSATLLEERAKERLERSRVDPEHQVSYLLATFQEVLTSLRDAVYGETKEQMKAMAEARGFPDPFSGELPTMPKEQP